MEDSAAPLLGVKVGTYLSLRGDTSLLRRLRRDNGVIAAMLID